jgi:tripartite-type tricarboxylate transporter receptor subunit TctC
MTGRVDFYFSPLLPALPLIRACKLAALAVSSTARAPELPDVPTTNEAGFPNSEYNFWFGVFAPANTPRAIVERMNKEVAKALQDPEIKSKVEKLGAQPMPMTPAQFDDYVRKELGQNAELVKAAGIKAQ